MRCIIALLLLCVAEASAAQRVRGTVRESTGSQPVPGAIVLTLDSARVVLARTITNTRGEFDMPRAPDARILRTLRLGFRPLDTNIPPSASLAINIDVRLTAVPVTLEAVKTIAAAQCPKRRDTQAAFSLLEQVRTGLLGMIVAREARPATLTRLAVTRTRHLETDSVMRMSVAMDSAQTTNPYAASQSARDFIESGFAKDSGGVLVAYGPDAEVLMDAAFANGYCFRLMDEERTRPHQIGLGFAPAENKRGRIDIDGALWVDTSAKTLVDIVFLYRGFDRRLDRARPGGNIEFRAMPNGVTIIDRWALRIPSQEARTEDQPARPMAGFRASDAVIRETGGEVASARWEDGTSWQAALGRVRLRLRTKGELADTARVVQLDSTTWAAAADSSGNVEFSDLPPGPYTVSLVDGRLAQLGVSIPTGVAFTALRDSTLTIDVPTLEPGELVQSMCAADRTGMGTAMIIGRILEADGRPADKVDLTIDRAISGKGLKRIAEGGRTGTDGVFRWCAIEKGWFLIIGATRGNTKRTVEVPSIPGGLTVLQFKLRADP